MIYFNRISAVTRPKFSDEVEDDEGKMAEKVYHSGRVTNVRNWFMEVLFVYQFLPLLTCIFETYQC